MKSRRRYFFLLGFLLLGQLAFGTGVGRADGLKDDGGAPGYSAIDKESLSRFGQQVDSAVPIEDYWRLVEETLALVESLGSTTPETASVQLKAIAEEWAGITAVTTSDNQTLEINHTFVLSKLRAEPPDLEGIGAFLEAMLEARDSWPAPTHTADDLGSLNDILASPEFQWPEASNEPNQFGDLLTRFFQWINRILPDSNGVLGGRWLGDALAIIGAIILTLVLFRAIQGLFMDFIAESDLREREAMEDEILTAETALKKAQTLSAGGDLRMAVRYLYLSTLLILEERGLFRYDRAKTNREYLRSLQEQPELAEILGDVVEVFDSVWYGYQPLSQSDYGQYQSRVEALRRQE